jgi:hypothetical protein
LLSNPLNVVRLQVLISTFAEAFPKPDGLGGLPYEIWYRLIHAAAYNWQLVSRSASPRRKARPAATPPPSISRCGMRSLLAAGR